MLPLVVKFLGGWRATVFAAVALVALAGWGIQSHRLGTAKLTIELVAADAAAAKRVNAALEERARAEIFDIRNQLAEATHEAQTERDRLLADLRSGQRRLRDRFTCPGPAGVAARPEGSAGAGEAGLSRADGEFLVRFASDADAVVRRLTACQAILKADRR